MGTIRVLKEISFWCVTPHPPRHDTYVFVQYSTFSWTASFSPWYSSPECFPCMFGVAAVSYVLPQSVSIPFSSFMLSKFLPAGRQTPHPFFLVLSCWSNYYPGCLRNNFVLRFPNCLKKGSSLTLMRMGFYQQKDRLCSLGLILSSMAALAVLRCLCEGLPFTFWAYPQAWHGGKSLNPPSRIHSFRFDLSAQNT